MPVHTIALLVAVGLLCLVTARVVTMLFRYAGARVITCPENQQHAGVSLRMGRVLASGLVSRPNLQLSTCSRWPEMAGCGQECLSQIAERPEECLVRTILTKWYAGKNCIYCNQPFQSMEWSVRKPALLIEGRGSLACDSVPAEELPGTLANAQPVCFACHTATGWVRGHPDQVTDRSNQLK
jgi:hypothetical protein